MSKNSRPDNPPPYSPPGTGVPIYTEQVHTVPPGYYPSLGTPTVPLLPGSYVSTYGTSSAAEATSIVMPNIIIVGGCPACRVGILEDHYTWLGILCAIFFFLPGILFCLLTKIKRCSNCGAYFS